MLMKQVVAKDLHAGGLTGKKLTRIACLLTWQTGREQHLTTRPSLVASNSGG